MKTTIRDVAKHAGVGIGTVSRVINDSPNVRDSTRQRVLSAIDELNFSPNPIARSLSSGKTHTIGVIVPFFTNPSVVMRLQGIESALSETAYNLALFNVESPQKRDYYYQLAMRRERFDGALIISLSPDNGQAEKLAYSNVPIVLIDALNEELPRVIVDDFDGAKKATEHLISLGHQRVALIGDSLERDFNGVSATRMAGYRAALADAGIPFNPIYQKQGEHARSSAAQLAHELFTLSEPPTAIFAISDTQAIGALSAAREAGINVPDELSIIGYDDIELAQYINLTTIRQPLYQSGYRAAKILLERIATPASTPTKILLSTELIPRGTTTTVHGSLL